MVPAASLIITVVSSAILNRPSAMPGIKRKQVVDHEQNEHSEASNLSHFHRLVRSLGVCAFFLLIVSKGKRARPSQESQSDTDSALTSDEDADHFEATQLAQRRTAVARQGRHPADSGIIESVTCTNFMCHSFLHVELGPLINFIVGHNGSGKSAVLTALTISLGGKASSTNRAGSLKSFVKEGQESEIGSHWLPV